MIGLTVAVPAVAGVSVVFNPRNRMRMHRLRNILIFLEIIFIRSTHFEHFSTFLDVIFMRSTHVEHFS